ncbi:LysR family transcriptional regulator [Roseovarius sp. SCSIO 43702]|uniref:LysR family transcriptional regulator n=1 Tax=Roseovarius sp. SCSIO 43702 TaxID=2823043 RepID=UPI001C72B91F|nr:LysR family transcriptional regulator [Roseovarius sp. SCSIO 43702]QYX56179.1 LysR family transcriptional regulator [Roseovarius sp. SCSIO 43702]
MINARQLEVLCAVIEVGTTAKAAELLAVSQPAVSNMVRHIETLVGLELFRREHGRLVPTPEARHIAQEAQHLFAQQRRIASVVEEIKGGSIGRLSIVATPSIGQIILPRVLAAFTKDRPKLRVSVDLGHTEQIAARLVSGRAELGLSISQPHHSALSVKPIAQGRLVCACPPDHEFASGESVRLADLNHTRHISYSAETPLGRVIDAAYSAQGISRRYSFEVRHTIAALELVKCGLGVALVDSFVTPGCDSRKVAFRTTDPDLRIEAHSATSNLFPTSRLALEFQMFFRDYVSEHLEQFPAGI